MLSSTGSWVAMAFDFSFFRWYKVVMMVSAVKVVNGLRRKAVRKKKPQHWRKNGTKIREENNCYGKS